MRVVELRTGHSRTAPATRPQAKWRCMVKKTASGIAMATEGARAEQVRLLQRAVR